MLFVLNLNKKQCYTCKETKFIELFEKTVIIL